MATLAFLHAHPDDEALLTSGTMARAVAEGHRVVLVVATDGAAGLASARFADDLAGHRREELMASATALGVGRLAFLGYADSGLDGQTEGGFAAAPLDEAVTRLLPVLAEERVDVLVGYDSAGGYGHPDHLKVHALAHAVRRAYADSTGKPLQMFEATLPREPIARAVRWAVATGLTPAGFDGSEFTRAWTPSRQITHRVNVRPYIAQKRASLAAHTSQTTADDATRTLAVLLRLPPPVFARLLGTEYYVEVR